MTRLDTVFVDQVRVDVVPGGYLAELPVVHSLSRTPLKLTRRTTVITGENGSGKSTLVEAIAVAAGANPEGGSRNARFSSTDESVSDLAHHLTITRSENAADVYFLRGETYASLANYHARLFGDPLATLPQLSHGQGIMRVARKRFKPGSLLLLDEPEDGLSVFAQLELLGLAWHLGQAGSQLILSTHSPILCGLPGAQLLEITPDGITPSVFDECETVSAWEEFIADPVGTARFLVEK